MASASCARSYQNFIGHRLWVAAKLDGHLIAAVLLLLLALLSITLSGTRAGPTPSMINLRVPGAQLGSVLLDRPAVSAFEQTGHRADIAE